MKKILLALGALIIIVIGVRGFWAYQQMNKQVQVAPTAADNTNTALLAADETTGWKTYTSDKYGLSFKYPPQWTSVYGEDLPYIKSFSLYISTSTSANINGKLVDIPCGVGLSAGPRGALGDPTLVSFSDFLKYHAQEYNNVRPATTANNVIGIVNGTMSVNDESKTVSNGNEYVFPYRQNEVININYFSDVTNPDTGHITDSERSKMITQCAPLTDEVVKTLKIY